MLMRMYKGYLVAKYFIKLIIVNFLLFTAFSGCAEKEIKFERPQMQVPKEQKVSQRKKGALYSRKGSSLFADKKDLQVGDIIQVVIDEALKSDSKNSRDLKKDTSSSIGGGVITPATGVTNSSGTTKRVNKLNNVLGLGFKSTSANSFKGAATSKFDEQFSTTISVIIEETYQNGNYYIKGSKEMLINKQKQEIILSGVIRPYDITPENSIYSSQIANLKILYKKDGDEANSLEKPWGTKLIETIWPF